MNLHLMILEGILLVFFAGLSQEMKVGEVPREQMAHHNRRCKAIKDAVKRDNCPPWPCPFFPTAAARREYDNQLAAANKNCFDGFELVKSLSPHQVGFACHGAFNAHCRRSGIKTNRCAAEYTVPATGAMYQITLESCADKISMFNL